MTSPTVITVKNDLAELARLGERVAAFGDQHALAPKIVFELTLALDEVLTNIITYAYDEPGVHHVMVRLEVVGSEVMVEVEDCGRPFNPLDAPTPNLDTPIAERAIGGLGIHLVRGVMSALAYERRAGCNVLRMRKEIREDR